MLTDREPHRRPAAPPALTADEQAALALYRTFRDQVAALYAVAVKEGWDEETREDSLADLTIDLGDELTSVVLDLEG